MRRPSWKVARGKIEQLGRGVLPDVAGHGRRLRFFCGVARMGGFTRASEQEGVAQPSLSQQILKLEFEMGAPLFERLGRSVPLMPCCELLLPQAQAILRQFADARHSVQGLLSGVKGRLTVGSIPTDHAYLVAAPSFPDHIAQLASTRWMGRTAARGGNFSRSIRQGSGLQRTAVEALCYFFQPLPGRQLFANVTRTLLQHGNPLRSEH